jgi:formate dehydrogenase iron-sulfur subunit
MTSEALSPVGTVAPRAGFPVGPVPSPGEVPRTLIDDLLEEQQCLRPLARFSRQHSNGSLPAQAKYYRDLIPLTKPPPGHQYAFEVDLDKCSGCKACVSACHSLNGLDEGETWRETGLLLSDDWRHPFQQTVTTACHHCVDPACLNGCPVLAYHKDELTGIVRHLDDQCIGCQYCVMKCPYDVPKYSSRRGIVRKCDMCASRLAADEAPACAQACPSEAIRIVLSPAAPKLLSEGRSSSSTRSFLPCAPDPSYTLPTTIYKSSKPFPASLLAADHSDLKPSAPHFPLVFMLVLMQLSSGISLASIFMGPSRQLAASATATGLVALLFASLHLGKPLKAWRAFLGWRKSWLSREVIAFSIYAPLTLLLVFNQTPGLTSVVALVGLLGTACSAMLYADTRREFWSPPETFGKFFGSAALLGSAFCAALAATQTHASCSLSAAVACVVAVTFLKFGHEHRIFRYLVDEQTIGLTPLNKSALLLAGPLGMAMRIRVACGLLGGVVLPALLFLSSVPATTTYAALGWVAFALCLIGELLERYLFFAAVAPTKMPGSVVE